MADDFKSKVPSSIHSMSQQIGKVSLLSRLYRLSPLALNFKSASSIHLIRRASGPGRVGSPLHWNGLSYLWYVVASQGTLVPKLRPSISATPRPKGFHVPDRI